MQGLRTNQKHTPAQGWRYTVVTFCLLLSWLRVISGWLLLFFSMLRLRVCQRRPAKLLTFRLRWKSDSCNSLECIRVFPEETLLSVFETHFVVFRSGFSELNSSFLFCFSEGSNVSTHAAVAPFCFFIFSICWAQIHVFFYLHPYSFLK